MLNAYFVKDTCREVCPKAATADKHVPVTHQFNSRQCIFNNPKYFLSLLKYMPEAKSSVLEIETAATLSLIRFRYSKKC